jgi:F-type H+-transporting ATPase subunit a
MENLGQVTLATFSVFGYDITVNPITFKMTWLVMGIILFFAVLAGRDLKKIPGTIQNVFEVFYEFLNEITIGTLGEKDGKRYLPFIITLFIFILLSNWIGIIPNVLAFTGTMIALAHKAVGGDVQVVMNSITDLQLSVDSSMWYSNLIDANGVEEPTKSLSTDFALAIFVFVLCQGYGIAQKGIVGFLRGFVDDPFPMKGPWILLFFVNPFFYLNLIGSVANVVSHSFRLFGNIFGGGMIIVIVSSLLHHFFVPIMLHSFFSLFAGLVQAFVFTMLAVTYLQQQQAEG